jgi:Mn-containing catalase
MIFRVDKLLTTLPEPKHPDANAASAVQELMGGKTGELSTLLNYFIQSNNFRGRAEYQPFYDLVANIAAEEWAHVELVQYAINMLLTGTTTRGTDPTTAPLADAVPTRMHYHFLNGGQTALPFDSMGNPWNGTYVNSSGNLRLDLVHNFFLELGARATKLKVYEMTSDPTVRELTGFLLVRGSTHVIAFAKALEKLSGVDVSKLFPIPEVSLHQIPECEKYIQQGLYHTMYRFSPSDYTRIGEIWNGTHPDAAPDLVVADGPPPTVADPPLLPAEPQLSSPAAPPMDPGMIKEVAERLFGKSV